MAVNPGVRVWYKGRQHSLAAGAGWSLSNFHARADLHVAFTARLRGDGSSTHPDII